MYGTQELLAALAQTSASVLWLSYKMPVSTGLPAIPSALRLARFKSFSKEPGFGAPRLEGAKAGRFNVHGQYRWTPACLKRVLSARCWRFYSFRLKKQI